MFKKIIAIGGTTAHQRPFDAERMEHHYITDPHIISTTVAEVDGVFAGFQCLARPDPNYQGPDAMPADWSYIASFVKVGMTGHGIGKALFADTLAAGKACGAVAIDATIRADNASGLRFYAALGFQDFAVVKDVPLRDGTIVDRVRKVYTLRAH